jgi:hypothetical protein
MVAIDQFLEGLCPLNLANLRDFTVSRLFSAMCAAIALKLCTLLYINDLQIKFKDGCYCQIIGRVMPLNLANLRDFTVS